MRVTYSLIMLASATLSQAAQAQSTPSQPAPAAATPAAADKYTVAGTDVGTLLDNLATKAILFKYLPEMASSPQIDLARSMTLQAMQSYAPDQLSNDTLAKINADLAKVPVKK